MCAATFNEKWDCDGHNKPQNIWIVYRRTCGLFSPAEWTT
jgi:hypothetical protein